MIEVNSLIKSYGDKEPRKVYPFRSERVRSWLWVNGAGKTKTLRILAGQLKAESGEAKIMDLDVMKGAKEFTAIGVVPRKFNYMRD